jgi:hypothetical protein
MLRGAKLYPNSEMARTVSSALGLKQPTAMQLSMPQRSADVTRCAKKIIEAGSDIVNLSRAKDAAASLALGILNADKRRPAPPLMSRNESPATLVPSELERIQETAA